MTATSLLHRCPIVPVVVLDDPAQAMALGEALLAGGITIVEITLRTPAGIEAIRTLSTLPELHVGAGSVLVPDQVDEVAAAGGSFVVSPGTSGPVLERAAGLGLPALPGVSGASDLMTAVAYELNEVKIFPAGLLGGPRAVTALAAPFPEMSFLPSGGVTAETMDDYLALPSVPAVSGSWMVERALIAAGEWAEVTARCARALDSAARR